MKYEKIKDLACDFFRRLTGVKRSTFDRILEILEAAEQKKKARGGKPCKLSMEDRLLMTLEYLREYRTYFHISQGYSLSESSCYRIICWIEDGTQKLMSYVDGGTEYLPWASCTKTTYTAGTYVKNSLAIAAMKALLLEMKKKGKAIHDEKS